MKKRRKIKLSILICTLNGREKQLDRLLQILDKQKSRKVEILIEKDNRQITTGAKRNILLQQAKGDYVSFIDDDDIVSEDYIPQILKAVETDPDCVGFKGVLLRKKGVRFIFEHAIQHKSWFEKDSIYYRCPNHLNPIKRKIALQIGFKNITQGEDREYSLMVSPLLKTGVFIDKVLYFYIKDERWTRP